MFEFTLARDLGMTVAELRETMSQHEFTEWAVFYEREAKEHERAMKAAKRRARH